MRPLNTSNNDRWLAHTNPTQPYFIYICSYSHWNMVLGEQHSWKLTPSPLSKEHPSTLHDPFEALWGVRSTPMSKCFRGLE